MPITLRTRPTCHYCGKRNAPSNNQYKFTCQYCQAENFFDEAGQIADVPASVAAPSQRYAIPVAPAFTSAEDSIFCATCVKNQYLYNTALAEYLPDPDHPEYEKFEEAIPAFKRDLERRYPTCCARCEPKVKAQLQQASYNARSDHLRRVLVRSRTRKTSNRLGWRSLIVNAAGLGWFVSLLVQLVWHALGSQTHGEATSLDIRPTQCLATWPVPPQCPQYLEKLVGPTMLLGVACIWWNPKWQHKLENREGRLIGLDKFYKVQGALLALRFGLWVAIKDVPDLAKFRTMMHTVSLILILMVAGWSRFSIIQIYTPRIVDWSQNPAPLLDSRQYIPPEPIQEISPPNSQQNVPVNIFNTATTPSLQAWRPPTPPVDDDAMEWDPTPSTFSPAPKKVSYQSTDPTPFRGTLPAFSKGGIYKTKQAAAAAAETPKSIGLPLGMFDKSHGKGLGTRQESSLRDTGIAQPKFFPEIVRTDTGLENLFDAFFKIQDEAGLPVPDLNLDKSHTRRVSQHYEQTEPVVSVSRKAGIIYHTSTAVLLITLIVLYLIQMDGRLSLPHAFSKKVLLQFVMIIPLLDVAFEAASMTIGDIATMNYLTSALSIAFSFWFYYLSGVHTGTLTVDTVWDKFIIASLVALMIPSVWYALASYSSGQQFSKNMSADDKVQDGASARNPTIQSVQEPTAAFDQTPQPVNTGARVVRRSSSDESIASTASIATTSTSSGWKTPVRNHREDFRSESNSNTFGLGGLSFKDDNNFGSGNSVAGPRTRRTPARNSRTVYR